MMKFKKIAVKAMSLAVAAVTVLAISAVGLNASAAGITLDDLTANTGESSAYVEKNYGRAIADTMSNDWSFLVVFFKSVDATVEYNGKTVHCKTTIGDNVINDIKSEVVSRMPYQFMQDTHGKVGIDAIDYVYVDEPLTTKDLELAVSSSSGTGYRPDTANSELVRGVLDECLEQNRYSQILIFSPLDEISYPVGWGGSKYDGVHFAHIIMPHSDFSYYATIVHEICHGLETDSKKMNNGRTANLHDMYYYYGMSEFDWYERYMNDTLPDGKKGVEPSVFYRLRSEYTPSISDTLPAPANLSAKAISNTNVILSWDRVSNESEYQFGIFKDADYKELYIAYDQKSDENSIELTGFKKGYTYYYGVRTSAIENGKTVYSDWTYLTYTYNGVSGSDVVNGDINNDGKFTITDVTAALKMYVNDTPVDQRTLDAAGISGRTKLMLSDVTVLLKMYVNS